MRYRPSFDPGGGRVVVTFVVRNSSHRTVDATARFWATAVAGHHVGSSSTAAVRVRNDAANRRRNFFPR